VLQRTNTQLDGELDVFSIDRIAASAFPPPFAAPQPLEGTDSARFQAGGGGSAGTGRSTDIAAGSCATFVFPRRRTEHATQPGVQGSTALVSVLPPTNTAASQRNRTSGHAEQSIVILSGQCAAYSPAVLPVYRRAHRILP
jgi:hypothetical protein